MLYVLRCLRANASLSARGTQHYPLLDLGAVPVLFYGRPNDRVSPRDRPSILIAAASYTAASTGPSCPKLNEIVESGIQARDLEGDDWRPGPTATSPSVV